VSVELSDENRRQLWVPRGFAHGFAVLSETADFLYKCDEFYNYIEEIVLTSDDRLLGLSWGIDKPMLSTRDAAGRRLADIANLPEYGSI
jgi:dTDP-4-dehydrorhamnose 3,5-epimerase